MADLLDTENPVAGVTTGQPREELRHVGVPSTVDGEPLQDGGLRMTVGWGHFGQRDAVMPGQGKVVGRPWTAEEREAIVAGVSEPLNATDSSPHPDFPTPGERSCDASWVFEELGETCVDVYLNNNAYWSGIQKSVWEYRIGGYQIIKKWLSYREHGVLGRDLTPDEASYVRDMALRVTAIVLLQPALDENYRRVKDTIYVWPGLRGASDSPLT